MADFKERLAQSQAKMDELKEKFNATADDARAAGELTKEAIEDKIATVKGDVVAGAENAKLAAQESKSKFNSALLKAQMTLESAKAAIAEKKEERNMIAQENRIFDLLDYADNCQAAALAMTIEANLALLEAAAEVADYREKYGN